MESLQKTKSDKTLVVIPAYNEEKTIQDVVERAAYFADVCVVNDASTDGTAEIVESIPDVKCISHKTNTHIPQTILDGMKYAYENDYDYVITMDAGLSHSPEEIPRFISAKDSDLVLGIRTTKTEVPLFRKVLSRAATVLLNRALRPIGSGLPSARFHDVTSGYRRYSRNAIELLINKKMKAKSFDFITEALMIIFRNGLSITEVPISYNFSTSSLNSKVVMHSLRMFMEILLTRRK